jgi:two-component system, CitB family, response regulator
MTDLEVIIVEDNKKVSRTHQAFVEKVGGFVVTGIANSIAEARLLLENLEPDLVLLDIYFAESNGIDLLREIRAGHCNTDVILITAAREVELLHSALQGGAFDYMIKPVFFERFQESLNTYKRYRQQMEKAGSLSQKEADRLFRKSAPAVSVGGSDVPKGIDAVTLKSILAVFSEEGTAVMSASEMGSRVGVSRTTARKYLEYLISEGILAIHLDYGTKGRPERKYRLDHAADTNILP